MDTQKAFEFAKDEYAKIGVDVEKAMAELNKASLSIHCWQGDDVGGFEAPDSELSGGGIQVTGNYPGKARNIEELRSDLEKLYSLLPGRHRLSLHASYGEFDGKRVDRDAIKSKHFSGWVDWAMANGVKLDFNSTCFSHPNANAGFTLSSKDKGIRDFWVNHVKCCREISAYIGKELGSSCIHNVWLPDGLKEIPADRMGYRRILADALDEVFASEYPAEHMKDAVECKLFGIGSEAYVVGSHEFYMGYGLSRNKIICIDMGHFHPTELIADKISSILLFADELLLHISRSMRWDSDHVVIMNDDVRFLCEEIVRSGRIDDIHVGLDFFDGSINRIGAWAIGSRATLESLLAAFLQPNAQLVAYEEEGNGFAKLALLEECKTKPFGAVWDHFCRMEKVPVTRDLIADVLNYEKTVLATRD